MVRQFSILLFAAMLSGAEPRTGVAVLESARALAIEDGKGGRLVVVSVGQPGLTLAMTDEVAAMAQKQWRLERSQIVFSATGDGAAPAASRQLVDDLNTVIAAALGNLAKARPDRFVVRDADGQEQELDAAALSREPIRAAFSMLHPRTSLEEAARPYGVQVVRVGKRLTLLALGGPVPPVVVERARRELPQNGLLILACCADPANMPAAKAQDVLFDAILRLMKRTGL